MHGVCSLLHLVPPTTPLLLTLVAVLMFFGLIYSRLNLDRSAFELRDIQQAEWGWFPLVVAGVRA